MFSMKPISTGKRNLLVSHSLDKSRLSNYSEKYEQVVQKQLEDDFKVHEYLLQNPNTKQNAQQYISLLNGMLQSKNAKRNQKLLLQRSKNMFYSATSSPGSPGLRWSSTSASHAKADAYYSQQEYLQIKDKSQAELGLVQEKTQHELEIRRILLKQITEQKKSVILLKGDIGHMITRNESISLLESKVNKVSLVSENQLKRVSLAFLKDKQETQLRYDMQKKFNSKLKNFQLFEAKNLKRVNASYIELMQRRKQIHDKLAQIEKQCASVEEFSDKAKQREDIDAKSTRQFMFLNFLQWAIKEARQIELNFENGYLSFQQFMQMLSKIFGQPIAGFTSALPAECISQQKLNFLVQTILAEYYRLEEEIQEKKKKLNSSIFSIEEQYIKSIKNQNRAIQLSQQYDHDEKHSIQAQAVDLHQYFGALKKLESSFKVFYVLLDYLNKKISSFRGVSLLNDLYNDYRNHLKILDNEQLHESPSKTLQIMQEALQSWFVRLRLVCLKYTSKNESKSTKNIRKNYGKNEDQTKTRRNGKIQTVRNEEKQQSQFDQYQEQEQIQRKATAQECTNERLKRLPILKPAEMVASDDQKQAKRVQLLDRIDKSYYKMIKETIEMERDSTKKNYQFEKTFKRNKYSNQDELLEEKRFQATFSSLFKTDSQSVVKSTISQQSRTMFIASVQKSQRLPFSSVHNAKKNRSALLQTQDTMKRKPTASTFWEKEKRTVKDKLSNKLKSLFEQIL